MTELFLQLPQIRMEWTVTVGNIITLGAFLISARPLFRLYRAVLIFVGEHEAVINYICRKENISRLEFSEMALAHLREKTRKTNGTLA